MEQNKTSGQFEEKLKRLETIVEKLESQDVPLDDAVKLFQEGKKLSTECETLLVNAQKILEESGRPESPKPAQAGFDEDSALEDEIPF